MKKILHILSPDKFTLPYINLVNKEFNPEEHLFLCCSKPENKLLSLNNNIVYLLNPYRKNLIRNTLLFYKHAVKASKIILHGTPVLFYLFFIPWKLKKTYWMIYGYEIPDKIVKLDDPKSNLIREFIKSFVLKRIQGHITHIEGDSELVNKKLRSQAKLYFSPLYLSNVMDEPGSSEVLSDQQDNTFKILVGNSTCPTNNHASIFNMLVPYKDDRIVVYCPLNYGQYDEYRDYVILMGRKLFGEKFVPLTEYMDPNDYKSFLRKVNVAIFNHARQEGMGVTLQLLSYGKVVYMNSETTSYRAFINRGFKVFDNELITKEGLYAVRDVSQNPHLVYTYYSYASLIDSMLKIFND